MAKCECQWLSWIPKCYGHCKIKQVQLQDLSAVKDDEPEVEDVPKIKPEEEDVPKIKPEVEDVPKIKPGVDLSDAKVAEEEDDEGFMCASFAHCPKAKIASKARENKISGDAKDAGEVARPEADLSMSKVAEEGVSIAKEAEKIAAVAKAAEEVAKPEVVTVQPEPAQLLDLSTSKDVEVVQRDTKSAAQVFMEEKVERRSRPSRRSRPNWRCSRRR